MSQVGNYINLVTIRFLFPLNLLSTVISCVWELDEGIQRNGVCESDEEKVPDHDEKLTGHCKQVPGKDHPCENATDGDRVALNTESEIETPCLMFIRGPRIILKPQNLLSSRYLLCSPSTVLGIQFSCPPGTKFQQRSLVCDHENNVQCGEIHLEEVEEVEPRRKREKKGNPASWNSQTLSSPSKQNEYELNSLRDDKQEQAIKQNSAPKPSKKRPRKENTPDAISGGRYSATKGQKETKDSKRGRTANSSRIPHSFSIESKAAKKIRPRKQNHRARERLRKRPLRDGSVETNEIYQSLRSRKEKQSNFWAIKERAEPRVELNKVEDSETDARVGGGVEDAGLSANLKAIITSPDSISATPPTPTSSLPPKVKPTSNGRRSQKTKAAQTHRAKKYLSTETTLSPKTKIQSPSGAAKAKRLSVKQPTQLVAALGSGSPYKEDPVHRLKPKSLKKLSGSLLSEVWKDERGGGGGGGQLKGGKKGEKMEIVILAEQERTRKKGGGGLRPSAGTRTISKTTSSQQTTNSHFDVTTPGEVFNAQKSALTAKSREIDEETSRVVAKLISQSGRGLEERSRGRHSLHRTTSTPHPYQYNHPPTSSTQTSYIPYSPYTPEPDLAISRRAAQQQEDRR